MNVLGRAAVPKNAKEAFVFDQEAFMFGEEAFVFDQEAFVFDQEAFVFDQEAFVFDQEAFMFGEEAFMFGEEALVFDQEAFVRDREALAQGSLASLHGRATLARHMPLGKKVVRQASRADLDAIPAHWRGELIDGTLYAFPRPPALHANAASCLVGLLHAPFHRGLDGGPGGWWILQEPGIQLPRSEEFSPDVAGWRRERLPQLPIDTPITVVPDWICEVLSKSTRGYDLVIKRRFYAEIAVKHLWYVDVEAQTLVVSRLSDGQWLELGVYGGEDRVRAEPFDAVELEIGPWWEGAAED